MRVLTLLLVLAILASMASPAAWCFPGWGHSSWSGNGNVLGGNTSNGLGRIMPIANSQAGCGSGYTNGMVGMANGMGFGRMRQMFGGGYNPNRYGQMAGAGYAAPMNTGYGQALASNPYSMMGNGMMGNGMMGNGMMGNGMMGNGMMGMYHHHRHHRMF